MRLGNNVGISAVNYCKLNYYAPRHLINQRRQIKLSANVLSPYLQTRRRQLFYIILRTRLWLHFSHRGNFSLLGNIYYRSQGTLCTLIRRLHLVSFVISTHGICNKMYIIALNQMFPYVGLLGFCILTQELSLIFQQQEAGTKFYKNVIQYSKRSHIKNI